MYGATSSQPYITSGRTFLTLLNKINTHVCAHTHTHTHTPTTLISEDVCSLSGSRQGQDEDPSLWQALDSGRVGNVCALVSSTPLIMNVQGRGK